MATVQGHNETVGDFLCSENDSLVLQVEDFVRLTQYVHVGLQLPKTTQDFRVRYPCDKLQSFFGKDPGLYDGLAQQLPLSYSECKSYDVEIEPNIDKLGYEIAALAHEGEQGMAEVHDCLKHVAAKESKISDPEVQASLKSIEVTLKGLITQLAQNKDWCNDLVIRMSQFQTVTTASQNTLHNQKQRWENNMPKLDQLNDEHIKHIDAARALAQDAQNAVNEATEKEKSAETRRTWRWGRVVLLATDLLTGPTVEELITRARNAQTAYEEAIKDENLHEKLFVLTYGLLSNIKSTIGQAGESLDSALNGIKSLMTTFSTTTTDLKALLTAVQDLEADIDETDVNETLVAFEDLRAAEAVWAKVKAHAKEFQEFSKLNKDMANNLGPASAYPTPASPSAPRSQDRLAAGEGLLVNQSISSNNGLYRLVLQNDGNLVLFGPHGAMWASQTSGRSDAFDLVMQADGNLVVYNIFSQPYWASDTWGETDNPEFVVHDNGNACIYAGGRPVWATNT
ncbi:MAG: hypothetical protein M4579_006789 [Chaenotheca gracillima]|nr:MAG: hypothetical protein M4579_006789 [Chaenotheca gracillima]